MSESTPELYDAVLGKPSAHRPSRIRAQCPVLPGQVVFLGVLLHHPPGVELRDQGDHGAADHPDPISRKPVGIAVVKERDHYFGKGPVKILAVAAILFLDGVGMGILADGEAVGAVVAFPPPAIENAQVQATMTAGFLAAGAGGFEGPARVVQPDVAAAGHGAGDMHIVVLDENEVAFEFAVFAEVDDVLDVAFAVVVAGMSFAREDELDRALPIVDQLQDVFELLEDQRGALVGGKAAREPDRERVRIEQLVEGDEVALTQAAALDEEASAGGPEQIPEQV